MNPKRLLADGQTFGLLFESLCIHDLSVYTSCLPGSHPGSLHYYGDSDGLEVDAIIELNDGRWAAIEIKLGESKVSDGIRNIERLRRKVALNLPRANPQPEFCASSPRPRPSAATTPSTTLRVPHWSVAGVGR
mgnify:CR=1 FL=1